jgi:polyphenol oxidase
LIEQQRDTVSYVQFSHFLRFPEITHGVFMRHGGYSQTPYAGLNVSWSTGDSIENVMRNRLLILQTMGLQASHCATLWQVHGADVAVLDRADQWEDWHNDATDWPHRSYTLEDKELMWTLKPRRKADIIITQQENVTLALSFADCTPILFYDPIQRVIAVAHAGWRGTARGVALAAVEAMREQFGCQPQTIYAGLAPSIGPCCYEVSDQVQRLFYGEEEFHEMPTLERYREAIRASAVFSWQQRDNRPVPTLHLDLWESNRNQLLMAGLLPEHIELSGICTGCNTDNFFSHRMEQGKTGRFPVVFALRSDG